MAAVKNQFKIVLLGEGRVGKTSTVLRYVQNQYDDNQVATIRATFLSKTLSVDGQKVTLSIWDTAGQERFHALGPIYYRDAHGALLVYDVTDQDSFARVKTWVKELRKMVGNDIILAIAGNKCDLERNRQVSAEDAKTYAASVGAVHFNTSAKLNRGIDESFLFLARGMLTEKSKQASLRPSGGLGGGGPANAPRITISADDRPAKRGCC